MLYHICKYFFLFLLKIMNCYSVIGRENIPTSGAVILVSNHSSYLDPMVLGAGVSRMVYFIAKDELFRTPVIGFFVKQWGALRVKRGRGDREAITKSLEILNQGQVLGIFIEGTRNLQSTEQMLKPQPGTAMLAIKSGAPVVPVALINANKAFYTLKKVQVIFGKPIYFKEEPEVDKKERYAKIGNQIVEQITQLKKFPSKSSK